ncbi:MAG TPA: MtnX-like HAD-IB family phosphatase [Phenylobacterium sp.]|uniref:MtnX-like HAD-IB family phosphatase n=1 Tax=Phenylobacterium sp. TaxID=1871053 RepID=UPI002B48F2A8|nr:MtnX-like HAD-IB family phosphatase [Phenylobacterium sp.]HKR88864.1 MtnX-like HAD-IB family phosphatase [Phenylobacterium sp.]
MHVFCDFDGTITTVDTTDRVLGRLAAPAWEEIEADWRAGRITAAACMQAQVALIEGDDAALDAVLDEIELADGFTEFVAWCAAHAIALTIVSDGVDYFIKRIMRRHGAGDLPIVSNKLGGRAGARRLAQPHRREGCAAGSGVCKCQATDKRLAKSARPTLVYVGDGRSDFCVSARADVLFARDDLAAYAAGRGQAHHTFNSFHDVVAVLAPMVEARRVAAQ